MPEAFYPGPEDEGVSAAVLKAVSGIEFKTFSLGISSKNSEIKPLLREKISGFISKTFNAVSANENFDLYLLVDPENLLVSAEITPVFIEGFYNKFSRSVAQTFHYCFKCKGRGCKNCSFTGKLSDESVQELLEKILLPAFEAKESKFHGCGREDVDVLMLGEGRPFVLEFVEPAKRSVKLAGLKAKINSSFKGKISVHSLKFCGKGKIAEIKNSVFSKIYSAGCFCGEKISAEEIRALSGKRLEIIQRTPERVEKRRAMKERPKKAEILESVFGGPGNFTLKILASHGLYIKEFISGDSERTKPSISSLLRKKCACKELDVIEIIPQEKEKISGHNPETH